MWATRSTFFNPLKTMNQLSHVKMAPAIHGPCSITVSRSLALSLTAPRNTRMTINEANPLTTIETTIPVVTSPTLGQLTLLKPAKNKEAPTSSNTKQAVVLTGIPKLEKP